MSKNIGLMQPYLFPYLGYFQLINAVDEFVLGDDLQYEKESWINRNRILVNGRDMLITFPLRKDSHLARINQRVFADNFDSEIARMLKIIGNVYSNAPAFTEFYPILEKILRYPERRLAPYAENSIRLLCDYIGIDTPIRLASEFALPPHMDKQDRVVQSVRMLGGDVYINPIGGIGLYDPTYFSTHGLSLKFHCMEDVSYQQFGKPFVPGLSIIDVLMFNRNQKIKELLHCYSLNVPLSVIPFSSGVGFRNESTVQQ
jgi:hypothetical protein